MMNAKLKVSSKILVFFSLVGETPILSVAYLDTDSLVVVSSCQNLSDAVKPGLENEYQEASKQIFEDTASLETQCLKFKTEGIYQNAFFKNIKVYALWDSINDVDEPPMKRCKGVASHVQKSMPINLFSMDSLNVQPPNVHTKSIHPAGNGTFDGEIESSELGGKSGNPERKTSRRNKGDGDKRRTVNFSCYRIRPTKAGRITISKEVRAFNCGINRKRRMCKVRNLENIWCSAGVLFLKYFELLGPLPYNST